MIDTAPDLIQNGPLLLTPLYLHNSLLHYSFDPEIKTFINFFVKTHAYLNSPESTQKESINLNVYCLFEAKFISRNFP